MGRMEGVRLCELKTATSVRGDGGGFSESKTARRRLVPKMERQAPLRRGLWLGEVEILPAWCNCLSELDRPAVRIHFDDLVQPVVWRQVEAVLLGDCGGDESGLSTTRTQFEK